jgi:hypothetical protein
MRPSEFLIMLAALVLKCEALGSAVAIQLTACTIDDQPVRPRGRELRAE